MSNVSIRCHRLYFIRTSSVKILRDVFCFFYFPPPLSFFFLTFFLSSGNILPPLAPDNFSFIIRLLINGAVSRERYGIFP